MADECARLGLAAEPAGSVEVGDWSQPWELAIRLLRYDIRAQPQRFEPLDDLAVALLRMAQPATAPTPTSPLGLGRGETLNAQKFTL